MNAGHRLAGGLPGLLLRAAPARVIALALLVMLASASVTLVPAWFAGRTSAGLPTMLAGAGQGRLGLEFAQGGRIEAGGSDPMSNVAAGGDAIRTELPASVAAIVGPRTDLVDTVEYGAIDAPVPITRVVMRFQPDAAAMTRYVDGRPPTGTVTERQIGSLRDQDGNPMMGRSLEVAVSRETADELDLHVGDHLSLMPSANITGVGLGITVTGTFEAVDPADPRWFDDVTILSPVEVRASAEVTIYHMVALLSDDAYPVFVPGSGPQSGPLSGGVGSPILRYRWRFPVDASGSAGWDVAALSADLARLKVAYPFRGALAADTPGLSTGLADLLDRYQTQRSIASTSFALAAAGPLAAGIGILALAAAALADRRRFTLRLLRLRGTGPGRLLRAEGVAALVVAAPAAVGGAILATWLLRGDPGLAVAGAVATTALTVALLLLAALGALRGPAATRTTRRGRRLLSPWRSRVLTGLVVILATGAAVTMRTTARPIGTAGPDAGPILVPLLLGIAGGIVLTRVFGAATRGIAGMATRTRGFAIVHALRGLARDAGSRDLPFVVLTVAVAAGVFASVVSGSLARSQGVAAANSVGADYRIGATTAAGLPNGLDIAGLAAIGPIAEIGQTGASLASRTLASSFASVSVIDADLYGRVVQGTLVDGKLAGALAESAAAGAGTPDATVPLILRATFASRSGLTPGTRLTFTVAGQPMNGEVTAILSDLPGVPAGSDAVVAAGTLDAAATASIVPVAILLRAGPDGAPIEQVVAAYGSLLDVQSRDAVLRTMTDTPMANAMRDGFALTRVLASVLAGVVVAASLLVALGGRAREATVLRALGVGGLAARRIVVGEAAMTIIVALATGLALGLGIAWLTIPDLGIERMAGVAAPVVPVADPWGVLAAVAGPVLVGVAALAAGALVARGGATQVRLLSEEA